MESIILTTLSVIVIFGGIALIVAINRSAEKRRVKKNPDNPRLQAKGAAIAHNTGTPEEAIELANKALLIDPHNLLAKFVKAVTLHEKQDFDGSEDVLHGLFMEGGLSGEAKRKITKKLSKGSVDIGQTHLHEAVFMAICFYYYGHLLHMAENVEEAEKYKNEAYKIDPDLDEYLKNTATKFY